MVEAVVHAVTEGAQPLRAKLAADVIAEIAVERREYVSGIAKCERQPRHLRHRHEGAKDVAAEVELELALLDHRDHRAVGAERALGKDLDPHGARGVRAHPFRHLLQADRIGAVGGLAQAQAIADLRALHGRAAGDGRTPAVGLRSAR